MNPTHTDPTVRHDFVVAFEAVRSNPNGDPDAGNEPRTEPNTEHGIVTSQALKRKIRDYTMLKDQIIPMGDGYDIFIQSGRGLNTRLEEAYTENGIKPGKTTSQKTENQEKGRAYLLNRYFDIRVFGGVLSTGDANCGQVLGPVKISDARSVDPVELDELSITRVVSTKAAKGDENGDTPGTFGDKTVVAYGLYVATGTYSAPDGMKTGATAADLEHLWDALTMMFEHDKSAARPNMSTRSLHLFAHSSPLGNAPSHKLHELVDFTTEAKRPRAFKDYTETFADTALPNGVTHLKLV